MMPLPHGWRETAAAVNAQVNALPYKADESGKDKWASLGEDVPTGDCEDYAIAKLRRLVLTHGFPIERLRLATCFVGRTGPNNPGEAHVVLVLEAPDDQYVLDNIQHDLMTHPHLVVAGYSKGMIQKAGSREWEPWA